VDETLFDNGVYHFGETVFLTEEEARDLLCADYFAGTAEAPWRCQRPRVMTVEDHEAAAKTAREKGLSIQEVCFWMDTERDAQDRKWFKDNGARRTMHRPPDSVKDNPPFEDTLKVRFKYRGEVIEIVGEHQAWQFVTSSGVEATPP